MDTRNVERQGVGLGSLLLVAFIVLKLCGLIHWSWLWVLAPLWLPLAIVGVLWLLAFVISMGMRK